MNWHMEENLVVNKNLENNVLMSWNYQSDTCTVVAPWKFDVVKISILGLGASLLR